MRRDRLRPVGEHDARVRCGEGGEFRVDAGDPVARRIGRHEHERAVRAEGVVDLLQVGGVDGTVRPEPDDEVVAQRALRGQPVDDLAARPHRSRHGGVDLDSGESPQQSLGGGEHHRVADSCDAVAAHFGGRRGQWLAVSARAWRRIRGRRGGRRGARCGAECARFRCGSRCRRGGRRCGGLRQRSRSRGDDGLARGDGRRGGDSGRRAAHHEDAGGERREGTEPPCGRAAEACAERAQSAAEPEASHGLLEQTIGQRRRDSRDEGRCDADGNRHRGIRESSDGRLPEEDDDGPVPQVDSV